MSKINEVIRCPDTEKITQSMEIPSTIKIYSQHLQERQPVETRPRVQKYKIRHTLAHFVDLVDLADVNEHDLEVQYTLNRFLLKTGYMTKFPSCDQCLDISVRIVSKFTCVCPSSSCCMESKHSLTSLQHSSAKITLIS